jgi:hypothetical protein
MVQFAICKLEAALVKQTAVAAIQDQLSVTQ